MGVVLVLGFRFEILGHGSSFYTDCGCFDCYREYLPLCPMPGTLGAFLLREFLLLQKVECYYLQDQGLSK